MKSSLKLAKFLGPYRWWAILAPLLMILEVAMDLLQPRMIQRIVDEGIAQFDMAVVINTGLLMVGFAFLGGIGGVGCTFFTELASQGFGADLRQALFRKVQTFSFGNLDELETGKLITRLTNDVTQVQELVSMMLRIMVRAPLTLLGSLILAVITSPRLALILVILGPLVLAIVMWIIAKAYPLFGEVQRRLDDLNTVMQENLAGVRVVKAFVRARHEIKRFFSINDRLTKRVVSASRTVAINGPATMLILNIGVVAALWFGGVQVNQGSLRVGELIAFVNYVQRTLMSVSMVSMLVMRFARAQASADRIEEVMISEPHIHDRASAQGSFAPRGRVAFEHVSFGYDGDDDSGVLDDITFVAEPGQTVAILGATGSGKSSLIHLIPRFYDVSGGRITIDGTDIRDISQTALRRTIGVALQEPVLFTGTIRDNIRYGRPDATDEEVVRAAKMAQAHEFIMSFPEGYDTVLGQRGVNLSGGQKQRIAIARALLVEPPILILDDSTSSVDVETESEIQKALQAYGRQRTCIMVAQRVSSVLGADQILVLDDGQVVASGNHTQLMESSPVYREIYDSQLGNGEVIDA